MTPTLVIPAAELRASTARSGGPGGQHVNKTETRVELRWNVRGSVVLGPGQRARLLGKLQSRLTQSGDLVVSASDHRSQHRNREEARSRLAAIVKRGLQRPKPRVATKPKRGAIERRISSKKQRGQKKKDRGWRPGD